MPSGRSLEAPGDRWPRWMIAHDRTRLIGRLHQSARESGHFGVHAWEKWDSCPIFMSLRKTWFCFAPPLTLFVLAHSCANLLIKVPGESAASVSGRKRVGVFEGLSIRDDAPEPYMDVLEGRCVSLYTHSWGREATPEEDFSKIATRFWTCHIRDRVACR